MLMIGALGLRDMRQVFSHAVLEWHDVLLLLVLVCIVLLECCRSGSWLWCRVSSTCVQVHSSSHGEECLQAAKEIHVWCFEIVCSNLGLAVLSAIVILSEASGFEMLSFLVAFAAMFCIAVESW